MSQWVCRNAVPEVWPICHFQPAVIRPSVRLLTRNCLYGSQRWQLNAGDLVTGAFCSYCAGRAFMTTTSGFTASICYQRCKTGSSAT